jgi:hypothetical protein
MEKLFITYSGSTLVANVSWIDSPLLSDMKCVQQSVSDTVYPDGGILGIITYPPRTREFLETGLCTK